MKWLSSSRGAALPTAMMVMFIMAMLATVALNQALNVVGRTQDDRRSARALAAADAGVTVALWRMNRMLRVRALFVDEPAAVALREMGCVTFGAGLKLETTILNAPGWCPTTPWHSVDDAERYRYWVSTGVRLDGLNLIERRIVVVGRDGARNRRLLAIARLRLDASKPLTVFELVRYTECSPVIEDPLHPDGGCPT